ncbi:MAG: hypothetical protein IID32_11140 [Planctomycetes bacterium]|nr:hypothetical protein [Planctomycetota bacterium]
MTVSGRLRLSLEPVKMGSLTIPNRLILMWATQWLDSLPMDSSKPGGSIKPGQAKTDNHQWLKQSVVALKPLVSEFFQKGRVTLDSRIQDDLRLVKLAVKEGMLEMTLEPMDKRKKSVIK